MRNTLILVVLILALFTPWSSADSSAFPIFTEPNLTMDLAISGDIIVWTDSRNGNCDIYAYDLKHDMEFPIYIGPGDQSGPAISGNTVVWIDDSYDMDVFGYDLNTQIVFPVCTSAGWQYTVAISGDTVVWTDNRNGNEDVYGYDLSTQAEFPICVQPGNQSGCSIDGDTVVWADNRDGNYNVYGYRLSTQTEFPICTEPGDQFSPIISQNIIVWNDFRNDNPDIYGCSLDTLHEFPICTLSSDQYAPRVRGGIVVWDDIRNGNGDIYAFDVNTFTEWPVCTQSSPQFGAAINGNIVVWIDLRNGDEGIYGSIVYLRARRSSDTCQDAPQVTENQPFQGSNVCATGTDISSCAFNDIYDVWNKYTPAQGGTITIATDGSTFDTVLNVYEGCGGAQLACNDDYTFDNPWSRIVMDVVKGKTYYIRVAGFNGETGDYDLLITHGQCGDKPQSDLNNDCRVNLQDFMILAEEWLTCGLSNPGDC